MANYIILDGARIRDELEVAKSFHNDFSCLYERPKGNLLLSVAPYLFDCGSNNRLNDWVIENGWGEAWGLIIETKDSLAKLCRHLRKFIQVEAENGEEFYFRFYDPRVLKIFLPTCDRNQILEFFGPVKYFIAEGNTKEEAVRFSQENGLLKQLTVSVDEIFSSKVL